MQLHPTAIVSSEAVLGAGVEVGPYVLIGPGVTIGADSKIGAFTRMKYHGERTELNIGNDNVFREFVTMNRGTAGGGGMTTIESGNFFMAYSHVAHDCHVGSHTIFANNATLAGHVEIGDHSTIGAFSAVHQFCRVGDHAFIGGFTVVTQDALPYIKTVGDRPAKTYGINTIGLQRKGFSAEAINALDRAYRILIRSKLKLQDALQKIETDLEFFPETRYLVDFIRGSRRGFIR